ncbi:MAG: hypothetical protein ABR573_08960 [Candidatus Dormibacteria bacterium]
MLRRLAAAGILAVSAVGPLGLPQVAAAAPSPIPVSPLPCLPTLKFAGTLYLDADTAVEDGQVGPRVGETDPNPARCGLPDRILVFRHVGHRTSDEVVYRKPGGGAELFRAAGATGFPMQDTVKWLVLALVVGILLFAALPATMAHVRQPPIEVGRADDDVFEDGQRNG